MRSAGERADFYAECVRNEMVRREAEAGKRRRAHLVDDVVAVAFVALFLVIGSWQRFRSDAAGWKIWLLLTGLYLAMWVLAKTSRR